MVKHKFSMPIVYVFSIIVLGCTIANGQSSYGILKKKLDGGYYTISASANPNLYFKYLGEYNSGSLVYQIFNSQRIDMLCTQVLPKNPGDNRFVINLTTCGSSFNIGEFYVLEVKNEKNETFLLKFKFDN